MAKKEKKNKQEFSKTLLVWESILIWVITLSFIGIVCYCIANQYVGELGWLASVYAFPWAAYAVSQACYYKKAEKENTKGGIKFESVIQKIAPAAEKVGDFVDNLTEQQTTDEEDLSD
jgi:hypothetical protein